MRQLGTIAAMQPLNALANRLPGRGHVVVCGDNQLAHRVVDELVRQHKQQVTVVLPARRRNHGPDIAAMAGVRVVEAERLSAESLTAARVHAAQSLVLAHQDDVGNLHAALRAQALAPDLRLVIRMFNPDLARTAARAVPGLRGAVRRRDGRAGVRGGGAGGRLDRAPAVAGYDVGGVAAAGGAARAAEQDRVYVEGVSIGWA